MRPCLCACESTRIRLGVTRPNWGKINSCHTCILYGDCERACLINLQNVIVTMRKHANKYVHQSRNYDYSDNEKVIIQLISIATDCFMRT